MAVAPEAAALLARGPPAVGMLWLPFAHLCNPLPPPSLCSSPVSQQAKRLEELDALYRDESILRKKIFNQVAAPLAHPLASLPRLLWSAEAAAPTECGTAGWPGTTLESSRAAALLESTACPLPASHTLPSALPPSSRWRT